MKVLCRWGSGGVEFPSGDWGGAEKFLKGSIFDARNKQFHQFHKPSSFSLIDVLVDWHDIKHAFIWEKEKQARKLRDRQEKESAKDANIERCLGKQVQRVAQDYDRLQCVVNIAVTDFGSAKRCVIVCALQQSHDADWTSVFRRIIHDFADDHPWFCGPGWLFFLFDSFAFCFFFFRFRFFVWNATAYFAQFAMRGYAPDNILQEWLYAIKAILNLQKIARVHCGCVKLSNSLYSRKFSSAKNFIKIYHQAVRQEFIFVKRRSSLVCSSVVRLSLFCLSFIFTFMNISDPTFNFLWKFSQEFNLVKPLLWRKRWNYIIPEENFCRVGS